MDGLCGRRQLSVSLATMSMHNSDAIGALAALAQETRLAIFRLLVQSEPDGLTAGLIAAKLELPSPTLSFHLKALTHARLIRTVQEGRFVRCHAALETIDALVDFLTQDCCAGQPQICRKGPQPLAMMREESGACAAAPPEAARGLTTE